jgi:carbon monoxide dehydrogenase subunit G
MKKLLHCTSFILLTLTLFSCDGRRVKGSGHVSTANHKLGSYNEIEVKGSMDVYFTQGPEKEAVIEADDNILPYIELIQEGDKLIIRQKNHISLSYHNEIKIRLTAPDVRSFSLSGSGNIKLVNTVENKESVSVAVSGSGNVDGVVDAPEVNANISGSGDIAVTGETRDLEVNIAGSGNFRGKALLAENANVNIAGSGDAEVHASVKLEAKIVGSGDVDYLGNPQVSSKIMGSGSISKKD